MWRGGRRIFLVNLVDLLFRSQGPIKDYKSCQGIPEQLKNHVCAQTRKAVIKYSHAFHYDLSTLDFEIPKDPIYARENWINPERDQSQTGYIATKSKNKDSAIRFRSLFSLLWSSHLFLCSFARRDWFLMLVCFSVCFQQFLAAF